MEEKVAEAVVEAQSQEDTTILLLTKLAFERTMQALSLHTDKAETEKENILKCLADFLGIKLGDIKYDDSFAGESVLLHHDVALEAYKAVLRILILKEESITLERCRLLMRFVCNIGISLEDAYSILDETMKESDTDRLARNTSVMQDHRGLDRKDDTMIQRKRNVERLMQLSKREEEKNSHMASGFVSSIIKWTTEKLSSLIPAQMAGCSTSEPCTHVSEDFEMLQKTMLSIQKVLENTEEKDMQSFSEKLHIKELSGAAHDAEDVLEEYEYEVLRAKVIARRQVGSGRKRKFEEVAKKSVRSGPRSHHTCIQYFFLGFEICSNLKKCPVFVGRLVLCLAVCTLLLQSGIMDLLFIVFEVGK
ncbi:uncharacterized protein LOC109712558 isoform X2 [Ananas comosus]|uniref:Uncharacterized protein LOC109712558 isoform X2 n=1 Tax=Ananas comosus TaxID=4615 RepID=A0A6P5F837_ANACO|nr:uncharacterized protein LOC109712558 isoform X2 [Ananas comosus]